MFKMKSILLIVILIYSVSCVPESSVVARNSQNKPVNQGDVIMQRITKSVTKGNGMFWWDYQNSLIYLETTEPIIYIWNYQSGQTNSTYLDIDEILAFLIPIKDNKTLAILGSHDFLRIFTWNDDGSYSLSDPIGKIPDRNYIFWKGHCDVKGNLYALARNPYNRDRRNTIMYKINSSGEITKIYEFEEMAMDFAFDPETNKKLFVITNNGKRIYSYDFDMDKGELSNKELFFEVPWYFCEVTMKAIEVDVKNNLWVAEESDPGRVVTIDAETRRVTKVIIVPHSDASQVTWGGYRSRSLIVGFDKSCNLCDDQSGETMILSGLKESGRADYLYTYK